MRYKLGMEIQAEVVDDRLKDKVDAAQKELQGQAAAYVDVILRDRLTEKLTTAYGPWYPSAQLAQIAVDILVEELKHTSLFLPSIRASLTETKDIDPRPLLRSLASPEAKRLTGPEIEAPEDDISDGV